MRTRPIASILAITAAISTATVAHEASAANVLVVYASGYGPDAVLQVEATGQHTADGFDAIAGTPTPAQLSTYDAVLVFEDDTYANAALLGDELADFVDAGGGVVNATFAFSPGGIGGRWDTGGYSPLVWGAQIDGGTTLTPVIADDPLLRNVFSFSGGSSGYRHDVTLAAGAILVANWADGEPLVARAATQVVALNFFPPSSNIRSDFWDTNTDGEWLLANAISFSVDRDLDGVEDSFDNCPDAANASQADIDSDGLGDACDADRDGDGVADNVDNCDGIANPSQADNDANGIADACQSGAEPLDILYLHTADAAALDVQAKLIATGRFASVDISLGPSDLATLQNYDAVLVSSGYATPGPGLGDLLADYADSGGGVVVAALLFDPGSLGVFGRLDTGGYLPIAHGAIDSGQPNLQLVAELSDHPLLDGVVTFDGGGQSYHHDSRAVAGSVNVASWDDGFPLVTTRTVGVARVAALNFFPSSSDFSPGEFWLASTDGADILANALEWAGGCDGVDFDDDGVPDACDSLVDSDGDGIADSVDNCPDDANPGQEDLDDDGIGDICDPLIDSDGDGIADDEDNCPDVDNADQADTDDDGDGNACDDDDDDDGVTDDEDNCDLVANANQADGDDDGVGDACEDDQDGDGVPDDEDNCPITANANQADSDGDGVGDACDSAGEGGGGQGGSGEGGTSGEGGDITGPGPGPNTSAGPGPGPGPSGSGGSDGDTSASGTDAASATGSGGGDAASDGGGEDGGCGCEVPGGAPAPRGGWLAAMVAGLAMTVRRRRRSA